MQEWQEKNPNLFKDELQELNIKYRNNHRYFIYKSIILRNLYGVDIMVEATEIAKLRLFLKMVAVVDVNPRDENLGLEPLPDIDFNIRCGNTLVGYATTKELQEGLLFTDLFARQEFEQKVNDEMKKVSKAYDTFKQVQLGQEVNLDIYKHAKKELKARLKDLNKLLNQNLHAATNAGMDYKAWEKSHQPFHWLAEYYDIIQGNGGFDVVIGNPPYVTFSDSTLQYNVKHYRTYGTKNLFALVGERCISISNNCSSIGYIIPLSGMSIDGFEKFQKIIYENVVSWNSYYSGDRNPSELFTGVKIRAGIYLSRKGFANAKYVSRYLKYYADERKILFFKLKYVASHNTLSAPKLDGNIGRSVIEKIVSQPISLETQLIKEDTIYYHAAPIYWCKALMDIDTLLNNGLNIADSYKKRDVSTRYKAFVFSLLNSSLFFYYWIVRSDCYNLTKKYISEMKVPNGIESISLMTEAKQLNKDLNKNNQIAEYTYKNRGSVRFAQFFPKRSKSIIDKIDKALAKYYGFTEEELDFIINYDIKYRMGDELNEG